MKALETGATWLVFAAAGVVFILTALAAGGVVAAGAGYGCW